MSRKRGLSPEEIAQLLRDLSDNESEGGELSDIDAPSDDEIFICPDTSDSSSDEDAENSHSENSELFVARDGSQWKKNISCKFFW